MKITHVASELVPGGGERIAVQLANAAAERGDEVTLVLSFPVDGGLRETISARVRVVYVSERRLPTALKYLRIPHFVGTNPWLFEQDVLHVHLTFGAFFGLWARLWRLGRSGAKPALIETYHSVGAPMPYWRTWMRARIASTFDGVALIAEDRFWRHFANRHPCIETAVIPNGTALPRAQAVSASDQLQYRNSIGIPDGPTFVVGTVGMLRADRKPELTIEVFSKVIRALGSDVHCVMFGAGDQLENLLKMIRDRGLQDQIHLPGLISDAALPLSIMDVFVSLNVGALTGLAGLEAAVRRVPLVGIQLSCDHVPSQEEWIWSSPDLDAVANRVIHVLRDSKYREELRAMQSTYAVQNFSIDTMVERYDALYRRVQASIAQRQEM